MKKLLGSGAIVAMLLLGSVAFAQTDDQQAATVSASSTAASPVFPIAELGGCDSKDSCHVYCEDTTHASACLTYALAHKLMSKERVTAAREILAKKGPGSCNSVESCRAYCADSSHQDECMKFAQSKKIIANEKVVLIKKLITGAGPGACKSSDSCRAYCTNVLHRDECRSFAAEHGLAPKMASTSAPMPIMRKVGSSTRERVMDVRASTTPGRERGMELRAIHSSSTPPGIMRKAPSTTPQGVGEMRKQIRPLPPKPATSNDNLGASVMRAFAKLLGF